VLVEGDDDERFIKSFESLLLSKYAWMKIYRYSCKKTQDIERLIVSINKMSCDYLFLRDFDENRCVIELKDHILVRKKFLDRGKIIIVKKEIESWYLAGLTCEQLKKWKIDESRAVETIDKEYFESVIPRCFISKADFMVEILKNYSIEEARDRCQSLNYFLNKIKI